MSDTPQSTALPTQFDPTGTIALDDVVAVEGAIRGLLDRHHAGAYDDALLSRAVGDLVKAYRGDYPGLLRCDTLYHDLRHALEAGLTMARMLDGQQQAARAENLPVIGAHHALLGVILALFHDIGLQRRNDEAAIQGASLAPLHEGRGMEFLRAYLPTTSLSKEIALVDSIMATKLIFQIPETWSPFLHQLGSMIATADLLSQMSDRCYIEKCRDFLFAEFSAIGIAGRPDTPYPDRETLLHKTPAFYTSFIAKRLDEEFGQVHRFINLHFGGSNPYQDAIERNLAFLEDILTTGGFERLRRQPQSFVPMPV